MTRPHVRMGPAGRILLTTSGGTPVVDLTLDDALGLRDDLITAIRDATPVRPKVQLAHCPACGEGVAIEPRWEGVAPLIAPHKRGGAPCPNVGVPVPWASVYEEEA